jgi:hypothetical protein
MNAPVNTIVDQYRTPEINEFILKHKKRASELSNLRIQYVYSLYEAYEFEIAELELRWDRLTRMPENGISFPDSIKMLFNCLSRNEPTSQPIARQMPSHQKNKSHLRFSATNPRNFSVPFLLP